MRRLMALALLTALPATAFAGGLEVDPSAFVGGHLFNPNDRLGRGGNAPSSNELNHTGIFGFRLSFIPHPRVGLEAELALSPTTTKDGTASVLVFNYRANLLVNVLTGRVRPFLLVGGGGETSSSSNSFVFLQRTVGELHAGLGLAVDIGCNWGLRADGRINFVPSTRGVFFTEDGEIFLSLYGRFGKPIREKCEKPPAPPKPAPAPAPAAVAPAPAPLPPPAPPPPPKDTDSDGIADNLDQCADKPGPAENQGCPWGDKDNDGLLDNVDKCPAEPETKNGYQDDDGCPDEVPAAVKAFSGKIEGVAFAPGKSVLLKSSLPILDKAAKTLKEFPMIRIEVGGHTDDAGPRDKNVALSQARAEAVKDYLVKAGVAADHVSAKGYGPDKPVGDNKTAKGKAANRRVEFTLVP